MDLDLERERERERDRERERELDFEALSRDLERRSSPFPLPFDPLALPVFGLVPVGVRPINLSAYDTVLVLLGA